jgi:tetratricopeptide (TPR) repeat protein
MSEQSVFISYAHADSMVARAIAAELRKMAYSTWIYEEDGLAGFSYLEQVHAAIEKCDAFILLATKRSLESHQVRREAETAYEHERLFIPVRFGISHDELRAGPIFRMISGTAVSITTDGTDPREVASRIAASLRRAADSGAPRHALEAAGSSPPIATVGPPPDAVVAPMAAREPASIAKTSDSSRQSVGRGDARIELRAAFDSVCSGRGMLVCVTGEAGIGKSTLVEEFLAEVGSGHGICRIGRGRCSERLAGAEAYLPLLDALSDLLRRDDGSVARLMRAVAPFWYAQVASGGLHESPPGGPLTQVTTGTQERLKRELAAFLQDACREMPVILFFDDLHWVDMSTVDILSYVARHFEALPALIIVAYRPEELLVQKHPFLITKHDLQSHGFCREICLEFLTRDDIDEYFTLRFPRHQFPKSFIDLLHSKTEGNPLFVVNVLGYLCDQHVLSQEQGEWTLTRSVPDLARELPQSVRGMIHRKIAFLAETDRQLLVVASVQGYEFDSAVVAVVLTRDAADVEEQLDRIDRIHGFVKAVREEELPDGTLTVRYRFVHILYQNMLFASLAPTRRTSLSRHLGSTLEQFHGERKADIASELAVLYETAREFSLAANYFGLAAKKAADVFAFEEALVLGRRALDALRTLPDAPERRRRELGILMTMGVPASATKGYSGVEVREIYDRARILSLEFNETDQLTHALYRLFAFSIVRLQLKDAEDAAASLRDLADNSQTPILSMLCDLTSGLINHHRGDFTAATESFGRVPTDYLIDARRSMCASLGFDPTVASRMFLGLSLWCLGYPDNASRIVELTLRSAGELAHSYTLAYALHFATLVFSLRGDWERVEPYNQKALAIANDEGFSYFIATSLCFHGLYLTRHGRLEEGLVRLREGFDKLRSIDGRISQRRFASDLAQQLAMLGQVDEGLSFLAVELEAMNSDRFWEPELLRVKGELLLLRGGASAEAEECLTRAIDVSREHRAKSLELRAATSLARLWRTQAKTNQAISVLSEVYGWFTEGLETADLKEAHRVLISLRARPALSAAASDSL